MCDYYNPCVNPPFELNDLIMFQEHWTSKAILQFHKLCGLKPLVGVVDEYIDGVLNIFLCDTSSNEDVYFHHVLRTEGHAVVCRENVPSKVEQCAWVLQSQHVKVQEN